MKPEEVDAFDEAMAFMSESVSSWQTDLARACRYEAAANAYRDIGDVERQRRAAEIAAQHYIGISMFLKGRAERLLRDARKVVGDQEFPRGH